MANPGARAPRTRDAFSCRVLRTALDWLTHLYSLPVCDEVWQQLVVAEFFPDVHAPGGALCAKRRGAPDGNASRLVFNGDGIYIAIYNPASPPKGSQYPVEVQYQGRLLSTGDSGLDAVPFVCAALEAILFPGRADDVAEHRRPGRFDLAMDVVFEGSHARASEWIERDFFAAGDVDRACEVMTTRVRKKSRKQVASVVANSGPARADRAQTQMLGTQASGRTWYYGAQWYGYEKDKHDDASTDLEVVKETWRRLGWNGRDRVLRLEWRVRRDWLANNCVAVWPHEDAEGLKPDLVALDKLEWSGFVGWLPYVARALVTRMRHTDRRDATGRVFERRSSRLWRAAEAAARSWLPVPDPMQGWGVAAIKTVQRAVTEARARKRFATSIADLRAVRSVDRPMDIAVREATLYECGESPIAPDVLEQREARTARRLGLAPPITLAEWHVLAEQRRLERGAELSRVIPPTVYESAIH